MFQRRKEWEEESTNLTRKDKRDICYYVLLACLMASAISVVAYGYFAARNYRHEADDVKEIMETVYAYMATATQDEYDSIAEEIRHDLVLSSYGQKQIELSRSIPNTSSKCCIEIFDDYSEPLMFSTNNGNVYTLGLEEKGKTDSISTSFGYDEISETSITVQTDYSKSDMEVSIKSKRGIVSVQRMKQLFCDECIEKILTANMDSLIPELIIYDAKEKKFYPIESNETYTIGQYDLSVEYTDWSEYQIYISEN